MSFPVRSRLDQASAGRRRSRRPCPRTSWKFLRIDNLGRPRTCPRPSRPRARPGRPYPPASHVN